MTEALDRESTTPYTGERHALVDLIKELRDETALLLRQEVLLARREIQEKVAHMRRSTIAMLIGGSIALAGVLLLLLAAANGLTAAYIEAGLDPDIAVWLGPLTAGVIAGLVGVITLWGGQRTLRGESIVPRQTLQSLGETKEWARDKVAETKEKVTR